MRPSGQLLQESAAVAFTYWPSGHASHCTWPRSSWNSPGWQFWQVAVPSADAKVPAGHSSHEVCRSFGTLPAAHLRSQASPMSLRMRFSWHMRHSTGDSAKVGGGQGTHATMPSSSATRPAAHVAHSVLPGVAVAVPMEQLRQEDREGAPIVVEYVPVGHSVHWSSLVPPSASRKVPASQGVHRADPASEK